jgi:hypothetical protein
MGRAPEALEPGGKKVASLRRRRWARSCECRWAEIRNLTFWERIVGGDYTVSSGSVQESSVLGSDAQFHVGRLRKGLPKTGDIGKNPGRVKNR